MESIIPIDDLIGRPFSPAGRSLESGVDCFGLLIECHRRLGKSVPDFRSPALNHQIEDALSENKTSWTLHWEKVGEDALPLTIATPGRSLLLAIKGMGIHVGFVHRPGWFIHAWEDTNGVTQERITLWKRKVLGVYEFNG